MSRFDLVWALFWAVYEWAPWVGVAGLVLMLTGIGVILRQRRHSWPDEDPLEPWSDLDEVVYTPGVAEVVGR